MSRDIWDEFASDLERLKAAAAAIRAIASKDAIPDLDEPEVAEAQEGRLVTRFHRTRERDREIVKRKKAAVLKSTGRLACEACGFDFEAAYGDRGSGFIECHHLTTVHKLAEGSLTRLSDLALVCANCHLLSDNQLDRRRQASWPILADPW